MLANQPSGLGSAPGWCSIPTKGPHSWGRIPPSPPSLPNVDRADPRRPGTVLNYLGFENDLDVFSSPVARKLTQHLVHAVGVHQKLTGRHSATSSDARGHRNRLICVGIQKSSDDGVVFVDPGLLLSAIQHPFAFSRIFAVLDPKFCHLRIIGKMEAQR